MSQFTKPTWVPEVPDGTKVLVTGASGGIGRAVVEMLSRSSGCTIGAHGRNADSLPNGKAIIPLVKNLETEADCAALVDEFADTAGGINAIVVLNGSIAENAHWTDITADAWERDLHANLSIPFFLARAAFGKMQTGGGRIILNGTESAHHGASPTALAYGVAKLGTEALVKRLAADGAAHHILVNGVRFGFIDSGFHQRWQGKTDTELEERTKMIPLGRAGHVDEAAALVCYLLSGYAGFITGQMIPLTGGDWL